MLAYEDHVDAIEREAVAIAAALGAGPMDVAVPTCPGWTMVDLATHVGQFCGLWTHVICEGAGQPKTPFVDPQPDERDSGWFASWFEEAAGHLVQQLRSTAPDATVWTWDPSDQTAAFVARRSANELAVHRFDAQTARASEEPIEAGLAVDGIDEIFAMIDARRARGDDVGTGTGQTLHLHATDRDAEWTITLGPDGPTVERRHVKADLALRGAVSDLELVLYQRPPLWPVEHLGDDTALEAWHRTFTF